MLYVGNFDAGKYLVTSPGHTQTQKKYGISNSSVLLSLPQRFPKSEFGA